MKIKAIVSEDITVERKVELTVPDGTDLDTGADQRILEEAYKDSILATDSPWRITSQDGLDIQVVVRVESHVKCVRVEYDPAFHGGDYSKVGRFICLRLAEIDRVFNPDDDQDAQLRDLFYIKTGLKKDCIIHYTFDELVDEDGEIWQEAWEKQ